QYNSRGHLIKQTDCGSDNSKPPIVTTYQRNAVGQVISKTNQDGTTACRHKELSILLMLGMSLMEINIWLAYFIFISTTALQYLVFLRMDIWGKFKRDVLCIPAVFLILFSLWISSIDSNLHEYSGYIMLAITISLFIAKVKKDGDGLW
ncbi:MAG: RHS repeat protein, partial [Cellvibrionaceae bacterium]|nr:RHS repeat protein [Cellvibrionaceae bacterium]